MSYQAIVGIGAVCVLAVGASLAPDEDQAQVTCFIGHVVASPVVEVDSVRKMPMMLLYIHRSADGTSFVPAPPDVLVCGAIQEKPQTP
jgi:hypothetical protein